MKTREDVVTTIRHLLADLSANPNAWENPTLDRYLDSMAALLEDSGKQSEQTPSSQPSWLWPIRVGVLSVRTVSGEAAIVPPALFHKKIFWI
jgi:hypothetical protein